VADGIDYKDGTAIQLLVEQMEQPIWTRQPFMDQTGQCRINSYSIYSRDNEEACFRKRVKALFCTIYLMCVGRDEEKVTIIEAYLKAVKVFRDYSDPSQDPEYSEVKTMR